MADHDLETKELKEPDKNGLTVYLHCRRCGHDYGFFDDIPTDCTDAPALGVYVKEKIRVKDRPR